MVPPTQPHYSETTSPGGEPTAAPETDLQSPPVAAQIQPAQVQVKVRLYRATAAKFISRKHSMFDSVLWWMLVIC